MKTNFEKVQAICNSGKIAVVETSDYIDQFIFIFRIAGIYRAGVSFNITKSAQTLGKDEIGEEKINDLNIEEIAPINYPPHNIKVGDKVRIMECARELKGFDYWGKEAKEMVGGVFEIYAVKNNENGECFYVWNKDESNFYIFPLSCVCLDWED